MGQEDIARLKQGQPKTVYRDLQESLRYEMQLNDRFRNPKNLTNGLSTLRYQDWQHAEMETLLDEENEPMMKATEADNILNYDEFLKTIDSEEEGRPHFNCVNKEKNLKVLTHSLRKRIFKMSKTNGVLFKTKECENVSALQTSVTLL